MQELKLKSVVPIWSKIKKKQSHTIWFDFGSVRSQM